MLVHAGFADRCRRGSGTHKIPDNATTVAAMSAQRSRRATKRRRRRDRPYNSRAMTRGSARVAPLLFLSGACALAYQTTWLRQFRLIFGASTFATAAVLAIFMGGLGAGSAILGKRADAHAKPLAFYGKLELLIAATAALSQPLLIVVSKIYFGVGGSVTLGIFGATIVRLILATLILGAPTFRMGGTLPAAARAVSSDAARRDVAVLYAMNTLGAVAGTLATTFYLLEALGNRAALFIAVGVNVVVGLTALVIASARSNRA